jgi:hypothetical protein
MVSHPHKCIFVHVPKAGGISIEQVFIDSLGLDFFNRASLLMGRNTNKDKGPRILSHLTAGEYRQYHFVSHEQFDEYFKFAFVRNPYDRIYSIYKYLGYIKLLSFKEFLRHYLPKLFEDKNLEYLVKPMYDYIYDGHGKCLVDFVGKLESIQEDFGLIANRLKLGNVKLQHLNDSNTINYKTYIIRVFRILRKHPAIVLRFSFDPDSKKKEYTREMRDWMRDFYDQDFEAFQYEP